MKVVLLSLAVAAALRTPSPRQPAPRMASEPPLRQLVAERRAAKQLGLGLGGGLLTAALGVGLGSGVLDAGVVAPVVGVGAVGGALAAANAFLANDERGAPLDEAACFEVGASAGKGSGLFAKRAIGEGAFLFDYGGERLSEAAFFDRYPQGNGRYIAGLTDDLYIDGIDPAKSNVARWMNHAGPSAAPNVVWRKQRLGPRPAMHFYACAPIAPGDELLFDYGDEYWTALGETPV